MPEALPVLFRLAHEGLGSAAGWNVADRWVPGVDTNIVRPHIGWLRTVCMQMASLGGYACSVAEALGPGQVESDQLFRNVGTRLDLRPWSAPDDDFGPAILQALAALAPQVDWAENDPVRRQSWRCRWMCAAALLAHLRLTYPHLPDNVVVPLKAPLGEQEREIELQRDAFVACCAPAALRALPQFMLASGEAVRHCMQEVRIRIQRLEFLEEGTKPRLDCEGEIANLLAVVTRHIADGRRSKECLRDQFVTHLVRHGVCDDRVAAVAVLRSIGIVRWPDKCVRNGKPFERIASPNSVDQAADRGRAVLGPVLVAELHARRILSPGLIDDLISPRRRAALKLKYFGDPGSAPPLSVEAPA